jgi:hypothetical protein
MRSYYPQELPPGFGLVRVRSPLLTESIFLSLPPGTEMFQFPGLARVLPDQSPFDGSPELIAVCHALEPPGAKTSPTRPYELGRTTRSPAITRRSGRLREPARQTAYAGRLAKPLTRAGSPGLREEVGSWLVLSTIFNLRSFQGPCLSLDNSTAPRAQAPGLSKRCYSHHLVVKDRDQTALARRTVGSRSL